VLVVSSLDFTYLIDSHWRIVSESSSRRKRNTLLCNIKDDTEITWIITNGNQTEFWN